MNGEHLRRRPGWMCGDCGQPWPCATARDRLITTTPPAELGIYLASHLAEAAGDMPGISPAELHRRFLGWLRTDTPARSLLELPIHPARDLLHLSVVEQIGGLLEEAMACDPGVRWVAAGGRLDDIHDLADRLAAAHALHLQHVEDVHVALDGNLVAGFLSGRHPLDPPAPGLVAEYERDLVAAAEPYAARYAELMRRRDARQPAAPHFHLTHLVIRPDYRRRGVASGLLAHLHDRLDPLGVPVYTTVASELLMRPLARLGYELHQATLDADAGKPRLLGLWRRAKEYQPSLRI